MKVYVDVLDRDDYLYKIQGMDTLEFLDMGVARMLAVLTTEKLRVDTVLLKGGFYTERLLKYWFISPSVALSFCAEIAREEHYFLLISCQTVLLC